MKKVEIKNENKRYSELTEIEKDKIREVIANLFRSGHDFAQVKRIVLKQEKVQLSQGVLMNVFANEEKEMMPAKLLKRFKQIDIRKSGIEEMQWIIEIMHARIKRRIKGESQEIENLINKYAEEIMKNNKPSIKKIKKEIAYIVEKEKSNAIIFLKEMEIFRRILYDYTKILQQTGVLPFIFNRIFNNKETIEIFLEKLPTEERIKLLKQVGED